MPWRPPNNQAAAEESEEEEEVGSQQVARPPADLLQRVRAVLPSADRQAVFRTFDKIATDSRYKTEGDRLEATIEGLLEGEMPSSNAGSPVKAAQPPAQQLESDDEVEFVPSPQQVKGKGKRKAAPPKVIPSKRKAVVVNIDESDEEYPAPKKARTSGNSSKAKEKKQPNVEIDLEEVQAEVPLAGPSNIGKQEDDDLLHLLAIFPDLDPVYARTLLQSDDNHDFPDRLDRIAEQLFNLDGKYKKVDSVAAAASKPLPKSPTGKGKGKAVDEIAELNLEGEKWTKIDARAPASPSYASSALECLCDEFLRIPKPYIRIALLRHRNFYSPTYLALAGEEKETDDKKRAYKKLQNPRKMFGYAPSTADLIAEHRWLKRKIAKEKSIKAAADALVLADAQDEAQGNTFECGCCFTPYVFRKLVQCAEGHLFCQECVQDYVKNQIGGRQIDLCCMDSDGCTEVYPDNELRRFIDAKSMELLERLRQEKFVEAAGLSNLDRCPFCPYAIICENENERLFRCANEECQKVSCRQCKKPDHLPKTCAEVEQDEKNGNVHKVEEAMTAALIRKCPKCQQVYVKESGCNKMQCSNCRTLSCFICGKVIAGYQHFERSEGYLQPGQAVDPGAKCQLFDDTAARIHREVEAARNAAAEEARQQGVDEATISRLALPAPPPNAAHNHPHAQQYAHAGHPYARGAYAIQRGRLARRLPHEDPRLAMAFQPPQVQAQLAQARAQQAQLQFQAQAMAEERVRILQAQQDRDARLLQQQIQHANAVAGVPQVQVNVAGRPRWR